MLWLDKLIRFQCPPQRGNYSLQAEVKYKRTLYNSITVNLYFTRNFITIILHTQFIEI